MFKNNLSLDKQDYIMGYICLPYFASFSKVSDLIQICFLVCSLDCNPNSPIGKRLTAMCF